MRKIEIDGHEYTLRFTTKAAMDILGIEDGASLIGEGVNRALRMKFDTICKCVAILANQDLIRHNLTHPDKLELLTAEYVSVFTDTKEALRLEQVVNELIDEGYGTDIKSDEEDNPKNQASA